MGTQNSYGGPGNHNPLVPTWLDPGPDGPAQPAPGNPATEPAAPDQAPPSPPPLPPPTVLPPPTPDRFRLPRSNFSRFVSSGGTDRASLGRAVSRYVSHSTGGARRAARRMGSSRHAGARLVGFLTQVTGQGIGAALRTLRLEQLVGQPVEEVFLGLVDYVCPDGGTVDEGIAREAFIETIAELAESGVTDLDRLNVEQMYTVFELYATHAIELRLCNDIGQKLFALPRSISEIERIQEQLRDFIRRGVADALASVRDAGQELTTDNALAFVDGVYEQAFEVLQAMGVSEGHTR